MLFVRDKGQMCNNILQYAHVYAWGREHGRSTMSMRFAYKYQYFRICHTRWHWFAMYLLGKWGAALKLLPVITFPFQRGQDTSAQEETMKSCRNAVVEGWRVEFYDLFLKYRDEINRLFSFDEKIEKAVGPALEKSDGALRLGVHIRRGDYKNFCGGKFFYSDETYASYIKAFVSQHQDRQVHVFICGNDPHLDREFFRDSLPEAVVTFPDGNPGEDLCLLSHCDYLIGAPSTFSLVASMYRDIPLLWMRTENADTVGDAGAWGTFPRLFREII